MDFYKKVIIRVFEKETKKPINKATVNMELDYSSELPKEIGRIYGGKTDENGEFVLISAPCGTYTVNVHVPGDHVIDTIRVEPGVAADNTFVFELDLYK